MLNFRTFTIAVLVEQNTTIPAKNDQINGPWNVRGSESTLHVFLFELDFYGQKNIVNSCQAGQFS